MATTTPNYGWDVPTSTDYVKDGATAIETLGDDIDASLYSITGGKNVGMTLLDSRSFTGASTVTIDSIFTSAYRNYKVIISYTGLATSGGLVLQFRAGGTTTAGTNYSNATLGLISQGSGSNLTITSTNGIQLNYTVSPAGVANCDLTITNPQLATQTLVTGNSTSSQGTAQWYNFVNGAVCLATTQFDGLIFTQAGNMTGVVRIYGLRD